MKITIIGLIALVALAASHPTPVDAQRKPEVIEQTREYGFNPPSSLADYARQVDVVASARISGRQLHPVEPDARARADTRGHRFEGMPKVYTLYAAEISDVLKATGPELVAPQTPFTFLQHAGEMSWRGYVVRANATFPLLTPGSDYVLLLKWNETLKAYTVEPHGVYQLDGAAVSTPSTLRFARMLKGHTRAEFLALVRQASLDR